MEIFQRLLVWFCLARLIICAAAEVDPVVVKGSHFFYETNGTAFLVQGMVYEPSGFASPNSVQAPDPLADGPTCRRDIPFLISLKVNVIRVTNLDINLDHSDCLDAFAAAGIYIIVWLTGKATYESISLRRWDQTSFSYYTRVVDRLANYTNVLGLVAAREVSNWEVDDIPFLRAAIRDLRQHMVDNNYRSIPIGWDTFDIWSNGALNLLLCGSPIPDFFEISAYYMEDPGDCISSIAIDQAVYFSRGLDIPSYIGNVACRAKSAANDSRTYDFIPGLFSDDVTATLSGAVLYTYMRPLNKENSEGLMEQHAFGTADITPMPGYSALSSVMATVYPSVLRPSSVPTTTSVTCPTHPVDRNVSAILPPKPYEPLCSCLQATLSCVAKPQSMDDVYSNEEPEQFNATLFEVCERDWSNCPGVAIDTKRGIYGAFSMCNSTVMYSWAANELWKRKNYCSLNDTVHLVDGDEGSKAPNCAFLLQQAGDKGQSTLTSFISPTSTSLALKTSKAAGLSINAWIGIGVGIVASVAFFTIGVWFLLRRIKRKGAALKLSIKNDLPELVPPSAEAPKKQQEQQEQQQQQRQQHSIRHDQVYDLPELRSLIRPEAHH